MERYVNYLNALTKFAQLAGEYAFAEQYGPDKSNLSSLKKELKKRARILLKEYQAIPDEVKVPELLEKIDKALNL